MALMSKTQRTIMLGRHPGNASCHAFRNVRSGTLISSHSRRTLLTAAFSRSHKRRMAEFTGNRIPSAARLSLLSTTSGPGH